MKKYQDSDIEKAKELRHKFKYSFAQLQKLTGIPATTIRNWCKNDFLGTRWDTLLITNERKRQELKLSEIKSVESFNKIDKETAKFLTAIMYWCEGSKYPSSNEVAFVNSDPNLLKVFINLLRLSFPLDKSKFRARLQIHTTHNPEDVTKYWSNILNIPMSQFLKPTVTKAKGGKHRKEYFGTCTLKYADFRIQLKLIGIYESFAKKRIISLYETKN